MNLKNGILFLLIGCAMPIFAQNFGFSVADIKVSKANCENIVGKAIAGGRVSYNPERNVLTLDNATILPESGYDGITNSDCGGLTIELVGENRIEAGFRGITVHAATTITGSGQLTVVSRDREAIWLPETHLTIRNTIVSATGESGIVGHFAKFDRLTIDNSTVRATGKNAGSIGEIATLELIGCRISSPENAVWGAYESGNFTFNGVVKDGEVVKEEVIILSEKLEVNSEKLEEGKCFIVELWNRLIAWSSNLFSDKN